MILYGYVRPALKAELFNTTLYNREVKFFCRVIENHYENWINFSVHYLSMNRTALLASLAIFLMEAVEKEIITFKFPRSNII